MCTYCCTPYSELLQEKKTKKTKNQKTKKWYKECINSVDTSGFFHDEGVRASYAEKIINTNLYNGILDTSDISNTINPSNINDDSIPKNIQHYPIINPRIEVLVGEEAKRRFDYKVVVTNSDAVSEKEKELNEKFKSLNSNKNKFLYF